MVFAFLQASSPTLEEDFPKNQKWEKRLQQSIAHHTVMGWYSPSQNYLKIVPEDNHGQMLLACGGLANFSVLYTAEPNTKQYIYYQVRLSISAQLNLQKQFIKDDILRLTILIVILFQYSQGVFQFLIRKFAVIVSFALRWCVGCWTVNKAICHCNL